MCHHKSCHNQGAKQGPEMSWPYIIACIFGKHFYLPRLMYDQPEGVLEQEVGMKKGWQQEVPESQRPAAATASHTSLLSFSDWLM